VENKLDEIRFETEYLEKEKASPLQIIRQKEIGISRDVLEAKKKSEQMIAVARRKATEMKEEARTQGHEEGKAIYHEEMEKAKAEAEKIRSSNKKEITNIRKKGKENMSKAIKEILGLVIPLGHD